MLKKKVIKLNVKLYNFPLFLFIELCCCYCCLFKNIHSGHKILEISDEESLSKENLTIESSSKELGQYIKKVTDLKELIEKEINKINDLYEKVNLEVTKSYEKKHEKLIKEENALKEKLDNEVTKVKEKLEKFLSESNRVIKVNERINKGIQNLEKMEKNIIKNLTYISKINKNKKETNFLFQELMRNLNISFNEEKSDINYEEYYFNGIHPIKDIEFKDITSNSLNLVWKIDNLNIVNIDKNKIKFKVEMKEKDNKEKFIQIYEGNNTNFNVQNLNRKTKYEFRICSIYNDLIGSWSEIIQIETPNYEIDSIILIESKKEKKFFEKIKEWCGNKKFELLYRGSRDGSLSKNFHEKCDNQAPTLTLYRNDKECIFGGYTSIPWSNQGGYKKAPDCFIFTLNNIHNTEPYKFPIKNDYGGVYHNTSYGPSFANNCDIAVYEDFKNKDSYSDFPCKYQDTLGKGRSIFTGVSNNNNTSIKINEIEVFKII